MILFIFYIISVEEKHVSRHILAIVKGGVVLSGDGESLIVVVGILAEGTFVLREVAPIVDGFVSIDKAVTGEDLCGVGEEGGIDRQS